jgi:RTA1 like protein
MSTHIRSLRSVYRLIELAGGWNGFVITTEVFFNVLDAAPIFIAMVALNICHPSVLLRE